MACFIRDAKVLVLGAAVGGPGGPPGVEIEGQGSSGTLPDREFRAMVSVKHSVSHFSSPQLSECLITSKGESSISDRHLSLGTTFPLQ